MKDAEGNTPHMLSYAHTAGVTCRPLFGMIIIYGLAKIITLIFFPLFQIKSVTKQCKTTKEKHGVI